MICCSLVNINEITDVGAGPVQQQNISNDNQGDEGRSNTAPPPSYLEAIADKEDIENVDSKA